MRRLLDSVLFRRIADAVYRARARQEVARFDRLTAARRQRRILLGLVHAAQATPFGRDHDFRRIRTEADYRRLLPLRTATELRRAGGPAVGGRLLRQAHAAAWGTALGFVVGARPEARLLDGRLVFLDGIPDLPALVRPYASIQQDPPEAQARESVPSLALRTGNSITCLAGPAEAIVSWIDRTRDVAGRDRVTDIWPHLTAVLYTRQGPADDPAPHLREALGDQVLLLETRIPPEGPIAVEDPRRGCLSLLFDHGVYFEFTPASEAGRPETVRHTLEDVEPGVVYEMALTSPAGLWGCRTGVAVRFERRDPPLFRFVEMPPPPCPPPAGGGGEGWGVIVDGRKMVTRPACPTPAPHRPIAGIPAAPPEKFAHTPWSTPADRG